jgi:hypothetical protein
MRWPWHRMRWRDKPGCFEGHLQRRYNNLLFPEERRSVTIAELQRAQTKDDYDLKDLQEKFVVFLKDFSIIRSGTTFEQLSSFRERIDSLLERACQVGGNIDAVMERLDTLRTALTDDLYQALADNSIKDTYGALQKAEQFNRHGVKIFRNPFVAQLLRKDTPIEPKDIVPSLLSEPIETVLIALEALDEDARAALASGSGQRVKEIMHEIGGTNNQLILDLLPKMEAIRSAAERRL